MPRKKKQARPAESGPTAEPSTSIAEPARPPAAGSQIIWRIVVRIVFGVLLVTGGLAALTVATRTIQDRLADSDRYHVDFSAIDCPVPLATEPALFLTEVRYLARLPDQLSLVDRGLPEQLMQAFALHPWVESVDSVKVTANRRIDVALTFRKPMLVVHCAGEASPRVVDRQGILLPASAPSTGLTELVNEVLPPTVSAGQSWPDPVIQRAVELAREHQPLRIEKTRTDWRLTRENQPVLRLSW